MFIDFDRQGKKQQAQKLNLSCSKLVNCTSKITNHTKKLSFPDILICVDLALKMGNQQYSTAHRWMVQLCLLDIDHLLSDCK